MLFLFITNVTILVPEVKENFPIVNVYQYFNIINFYLFFKKASPNCFCCSKILENTGHSKMIYCIVPRDIYKYMQDCPYI